MGNPEHTIRAPKLEGEMKTIRKFLELEKQVTLLNEQRETKTNQNPANFSIVIARVRYFLEQLDELLLKQIDPIKKAQFFAAIFDKLPSYEEIKSGTRKTPLFTGVNPVFETLLLSKSDMVISPGIEPGLPG